MTESQMATVPEVEVDPKAHRRQFSAKYKLDILKRVSACVAHGQLGELLRSEGLYSSHLATWRRQRDAVGRANPEEAWTKEGGGGRPRSQDRGIATRERPAHGPCRTGRSAGGTSKKSSGLLGTPLESDKS